MCLRSLGFILILFPGVLQAQGCDAPSLVHGNFLPKQETYSHRTRITYSCDNGYKPVVEGWWATSTCQHGKWSHEPQCIDERACLPPTIPNAKFENSNSWYQDGSIIRITCDAGFEHQNHNTVTTCRNGKWSSVPVCEKSINACSAPPKIPHAVIINQEYQEVFAAGSRVQYECGDGYTTEGADTKQSVCIQGNWTAGPTCRSSNERETRLRYTTIENCGNRPVIPNGVVVQTDRYYLKYQCQRLYRLVGPDTVKCISSGMWSDVPVCRAAFCTVNTDEDPQYISAGTVYIEDGEEKRVECVKPHSWSLPHYAKVRCIKGRVDATECCNSVEHALSCD